MLKQSGSKPVFDVCRQNLLTGIIKDWRQLGSKRQLRFSAGVYLKDRMTVSFSLSNLLERIMKGDLKEQRRTEHGFFTRTGESDCLKRRNSSHSLDAVLKI